MSSFKIFIIRADSNEYGLIDIPPGQHDSETLGCELQRACQRAYELGRRDQSEQLEQLAQDFVAQARKLRRDI